MGEIRNDAAVMAALGRQMTRAVQRQAVAAGNLANLDTPGYQTKEVRFTDTLDDHLQGGVTVAVTNKAHFGGPQDRRWSRVRKRRWPSGRRDGNNVQLDRELLAMGKAAGDFSAAQTILAAKFRLVRYAINEGR